MDVGQWAGPGTASQVTIEMFRRQVDDPLISALYHTLYDSYIFTAPLFHGSVSFLSIGRLTRCGRSVARNDGPVGIRSSSRTLPVVARGTSYTEESSDLDRQRNMSLPTPALFGKRVRTPSTGI